MTDEIVVVADADLTTAAVHDAETVVVSVVDGESVTAAVMGDLETVVVIPEIDDLAVVQVAVEGPQGQQGESGADGLPGPPGPPGADGLPGADGADGVGIPELYTGPAPTGVATYLRFVLDEDGDVQQIILGTE